MLFTEKGLLLIRGTLLWRTTTIANTLSIVVILKRGRLVRLSAYSFQLQYNLLPAKLLSAINICDICFIYNLLKYYKYCGKSIISNYFLFRILGTVLLPLPRILGSTVPLPYYSLGTTVLLLDLALFFQVVVEVGQRYIT